MDDSTPQKRLNPWVTAPQRQKQEEELSKATEKRESEMGKELC